MSEQNQQIYRELMNSGIDFPWISSTVRSIQPLLEGAVEITLKKGDILYDESYDGRYVYVVKSGRVGNYFITSDGHEKLVGIFVKGSLLGEMHVLDEKSGYYISQVTSRQATLYQVTRETFLQKLQEIPCLLYTSVSQEEINEQLLQDVSKVTFFSMPLTNDDGDAMSDEEKTQAREQVQGFVDRVNAGEDIDTVIAEYEGEESTHDHTQEGVHDLVIYQDTMQNYYTYGTLFSDELMEAAFSGEYGVAQLVEDSSNLYMILRKDVREDADLLESMTPTIIEELKGDAFDETIAQWGTEVTGVTFNGDAVNYYTPDKLNFES